MLDTIPYIFFFALRADGKGVFLCIYRPGCFRTVRGRSEGNWQENRLLYSKYLTLQYILMRSRNRERDLAYVAWKGGAWGIGRRKGCFQLKSRLYIHFSLHVRQNHVYSHRLWRIHQTHVYSHLLWHVHQNHAYSHLLLHVWQNHAYSHLLPHVRQNHAYSPGPDSHACLPFSFELCWSPAISRSLCCAHEKVIQEKVDF